MGYMVGNIDVIQLKSAPLDSKISSNYDGFRPSTTVLPKGHRRNGTSRPFPVDTIYEKDIAIPMRDGVTLYGDVFRPTDETQKVPAIIPWSPYGKTGSGYFSLNNIPYRVGVPASALSGYEKFEAPDPAEWTQHGYAVVNIDARGAFMSEGDIRYYGTGEGRDGYDAIEHIAKQDWCNGKVALMGNSWLASAAWFIAAERPPSLACMLPLEGLSDMYRENFCRGGIPYPAFFGPYMASRLFGNNKTEDLTAMVEKYPLMNQYWADKRAKVDNINVPAYVLASMSTSLHTVGSLRGFEDIPHNNKWLRLHATQEWHDLYQPESNAEFKKFLDRFTKGVQNNWEDTPKARISVLRYNDTPLVNLPFSNYPVPGTQWRSFYLSQGGSLVEEGPSGGKVCYDSTIVSPQVDNDPEEAVFTYTFQETCTLVGPAKAILYMSCAEHDDMDVFVQIRKAGEDGNVLQNVNIPLQELGAASSDELPLINVMKYLGPTGALRASHRTIDPILSKPHWPTPDHSKELKIPLGAVVRLEIGLWPAAIQWMAGERLVVKVSGHHMGLAEFPHLRGKYTTGNKGRHVLHFGGDLCSHFEIPVVQL